MKTFNEILLQMQKGRFSLQLSPTLNRPFMYDNVNTSYLYDFQDIGYIKFLLYILPYTDLIENTDYNDYFDGYSYGIRLLTSKALSIQQQLDNYYFGLGYPPPWIWKGFINWYNDKNIYKITYPAFSLWWKDWQNVNSLINTTTGTGAVSSYGGKSCPILYGSDSHGGGYAFTSTSYPNFLNGCSSLTVISVSLGHGALLYCRGNTSTQRPLLFLANNTYYGLYGGLYDSYSNKVSITKTNTLDLLFASQSFNNTSHLYTFRYNGNTFTNTNPAMSSISFGDTYNGNIVGSFTGTYMLNGYFVTLCSYKVEQPLFVINLIQKYLSVYYSFDYLEFSS